MCSCVLLCCLVFSFLEGPRTVCCDVSTLSLRRGPRWELRAAIQGERFDATRHKRGTEVKAITYSAAEVVETPDRCDIYVIVDI